MSRRDRRRWAALLRKLHAEAAGVIEINIFDGAAILNDAHGRGAAAEWAKRVANDNRPLCLTCDHEWRSPAAPPAAFVTVLPARSDPRHLLAMGLCQPCATHSDCEARIATALKQIWPEGKLLARPHKAPRGVR